MDIIYGTVPELYELFALEDFAHAENMKHYSVCCGR
jgi:hypothetical protein